MNVKLLSVAATVGGVGIGVPLYLLQTGNSPEITAQSSQPSSVGVAQTTSSDTAPELEKKSIAKGDCTVIEVPSEIKEFFGEEYKEENDYVLVSCTNNTVQDDYAPLPSGWKGWFPNFAFSAEAKTTLGSKLEINTETKIDHDYLGISFTEITFAGSGLKKVYNAKLNTLSPKNLKENVFTASVWDEGLKRNKLIYVFSPKQAEGQE